MTLLLRAFLVSSLILGLAGCESKQDDAKTLEQGYFFLEALKQVEAGGRKLQHSDLDQAQLNEALANLDDGLKLAFQLERPFLDKLDLRLGKNFERYFIKGVENYRIGIEAGDRSQQEEGLRLLQKWSQFWHSAEADVLAQLKPG